MAENLNYADSAKTPSLKGKSWCFGNDSLKCKVTGRLYTWAAAMDSVKTGCESGYGSICEIASVSSATLVQGICPTGWHLPSQSEWSALFTAVGGQSKAGKILKSQTGWSNNGNGTDAFGFAALPAGYRSNNGSFNDEGHNAYFWGSTEYDATRAYRMSMYYLNETANLDYYNYRKHDAFSVRCVKDEE